MNTLSRSIAATALLLLAASGARAEVEIGKTAPDFSLPASDGKTYSLAQFKGKFIVLEWTNHGCPFVKKHYGSGNMQKLQKEYTGKDVVWLQIISSAPGKQGYVTAEEAKSLYAKQGAAATATLLDPDGKAGHLYGAQTTPHMFVISPDGKLIYMGAIDDKPSPNPGDIPTSKNYVAAALDEAMAGKAVSTPVTKSYGCSVKYP